MEDQKPEFIVTPSIFVYIIPTLLIIATLMCYFARIYYIPLIILALITTGSLLSHHLTILVYKDHFIFRYRNFFGKLMEDTYEFYFEDLKTINSDIDDWLPNATQSLVIIIFGALLPGRLNLFRSTSAELTIVTQIKGSPEEKTTINMGSVTRRTLEAIHLISGKISKNKNYVQ